MKYGKELRYPNIYGKYGIQYVAQHEKPTLIVYRNPRSVCPFIQSDQGFECPLTELVISNLTSPIQMLISKVFAVSTWRGIAYMR